MDSNTRLDYALFQLTPTRTRCDLVVFSKGKSEKIASGLLEPFISHLKFAKDQIPKGGYSITLRAPTPNASWFTKGTLERFVRFVSTPEVLERFVTIEKEILQIEISVQSNELSNAAEEDADSNAKKSVIAYKPKGESDGTNEAVQEDNSKLRLQRVLETRKAVLRKEQAMAYARSFVAGYEMDYIDDLIAFADAFGASRLREACINFKELCNKKHGDGLWMDELAAMEVYAQPELPYLGTSGIILTTENNLPSRSIMQSFSNGKLERGGSVDTTVSESTTSPASSDANQGQVPPATAQAQYPMSWPNQFPQFMYNYQGPGMHQMPPYQGYPFPPMQVPPHYQGNMQWPQRTDEYSDSQREPRQRRNGKSSSRKKEKSSHGKESQDSEQDAGTEPSDSTSGTDSDADLQQDRKDASTEKQHKRKKGKKSSRMVVIRNINYITSKKKDGEKDDVSDESSTDEDEFINGESLKQKLEDAVGSMEKHHKSTSRYHKKVGGKKNLAVANKLNGDVNHDLDDDPVYDVSEEGKTTENWDTFQNLLLKEDDSGPNETEKHKTLGVQDEYFTIQSTGSGQPFPINHTVDMETEKGTKQRLAASDAFVVNERLEGQGGNTHLENFENGENFHPIMKKRDYMDEEFMFSQRAEDARRHVQDSSHDYSGESSVIKTQKGEDWFIINQPGRSLGTDASNERSIFKDDHALSFGGDYIQTEKSKKDVLVDDSFMVQSRSAADDHSDSHWRTDYSMISDLTSASQPKSGAPDLSEDKNKLSGTYEPDDLYMVLERDSGPDRAVGSWTPELDYEMDISFKESDRRHSSADTDDKPANGVITNGDPETKLPGKETRSKPLRGALGKSKTEIISRNRKPSSLSRLAAPRSKSEKDEDIRKKMEELAIQRQKRIAERSAARGFTPAASKKSPVESKKTVTSLKGDKQSARSATQDTKKSSLQKPGTTSSSIDRLAYGQVKNKELSTPPPKPTQPKKAIPKVNGVVATTSSPRTSKDENKKSGSNQAKPSKKLAGPISISPKEKDRTDESESILQRESHAPKEAQPLHAHDTSEGKMALHEPPSTIVKAEQKNVSDVYLVNKSRSEDPIDLREPSVSVEEHTTKLNSLKLEDSNSGVSTASPVLHEESNVGYALQTNGFNTKNKVDPLPAEPKSDLNPTGVNTEEEIAATNGRVSVPAEISEEEITHYPVESTPPSSVELSLEATPSRKKWTSNESSSAAKGLKKLLLFGRKKPIAYA